MTHINIIAIRYHFWKWVSRRPAQALRRVAQRAQAARGRIQDKADYARQAYYAPR